MKNWAPAMRPVMMTDDIALVGGTPVAVHCLIAEEGGIVLDTGVSCVENRRDAMRQKKREATEGQKK